MIAALRHDDPSHLGVELSAIRKDDGQSKLVRKGALATRRREPGARPLRGSPGEPLRFHDPTGVLEWPITSYVLTDQPKTLDGSALDRERGCLHPARAVVVLPPGGFAGLLRAGSDCVYRLAVRLRVASRIRAMPGDRVHGECTDPSRCDEHQGSPLQPVEDIRRLSHCSESSGDARRLSLGEQPRVHVTLQWPQSARPSWFQA